MTPPAGLGIARRSYPEWDQLVYASRGVISVRTAAGTWVVPPHRAVWIPADTEFGVDLAGRVSFRTLFFRPRLSPRMPRECRAIEISPVVRELILHASKRSTLRRDLPSDLRLARVILDLLETRPTEPLQLPLPTDPRARRAAAVLQAEPSLRGSLAAVERAAAASRRTLERLFLAETRMTLGRWRKRAALIEALRELAEGRCVTEVAFAIGYDSPSAFISAFRRELGTTPGRYFRSAASPS